MTRMYHTLCIRLIAFLSLIMLFDIGDLHGQDGINTRITATFYDVTVVEVLQIIENRFGVTIYYIPDRVPYFRINKSFEDTPLYEALPSIVEGANMRVVHYEGKIILVNKLGFSREVALDIIARWESGEYEKPVDNSAIVIQQVFGDSNTVSGSALRLSGTISDTYTSEPIIGAVIGNAELGVGTVSDDNGAFALELKAGKQEMTVSYLGYRDIVLEIGLYEDAEVSIQMEVAAVRLDEVVVEAANAQDKIEETQIGIEMLSPVEIKSLPSFMGEADIFKGLEQLPGVSSVGEASTGLNVRGGNIDQNLILLDEAIVFNATHALGFFSVFHPDMVSNVTLYKGNIPAKYGGRLSSVIAVDMKQGNETKWRADAGIGPASARLVVEGPVNDDGTSIIAGGRTTFNNWILKRAPADDVSNSRLYFTDGLVKLKHRISDSQSLTLTGYGSYDSFQFSDEFRWKWSSVYGNAGWNLLVSNSLAISADLAVGTYRTSQSEFLQSGSFELFNGIGYIKGKANLSWQNATHSASGGVELIRYNMRPEEIEPLGSESDISAGSLEKDRGYDMSAYIEDDWKLTDKLSIAAGVRFNVYSAVGPRTVYLYDDEKPKSGASVVDSVMFSSGEQIKTYSGFEPRVSLNYILSDKISVKAGYSRTRQNLHLISNTVSGTPVDIWQLAGYHIRPGRSDNFSLGAFFDIGEEWSTSLEGFYKLSDDLVQYKDFARLAFNDQLETEVLQGEGRAYGAEFLIRRSRGRVSGQFAYTYSRSLSRVKGRFASETLEGGDWFPYQFDQPHQLSAFVKLQANPVSSLQLAFTYQTGRPVTAPIASYPQGHALVTQYAGRNAVRLPAYHRLDFSYTLDNSEARLKGTRHSFTFTFYNLYGRNNAYSVFFRRDSRNILRAYQLSIFGSVIPSFTWNMTFS